MISVTELVKMIMWLIKWSSYKCVVTIFNDAEAGGATKHNMVGQMTRQGMTVGVGKSQGKLYLRWIIWDKWELTEQRGTVKAADLARNSEHWKNSISMERESAGGSKNLTGFIPCMKEKKILSISYVHSHLWIDKDESDFFIYIRLPLWGRGMGLGKGEGV